MKINKKRDFIKTTKPISCGDADFNIKGKLDELFPEIIKIKQTETPKPKVENNAMNYLENAKKPTIQTIAPKVNLPKGAGSELKVNDFNYLEVNFQMSRMISRWDEYTKTYKMLYGDDIYDKMYVFPNYNYDYFDILDNKYEQEQEELEISENAETYDEAYDNYIYVKYEI